MPGAVCYSILKFFLYPPLRISRFFTFEGAAVMGEKVVEIDLPHPLYKGFTIATHIFNMIYFNYPTKEIGDTYYEKIIVFINIYLLLNTLLFCNKLVPIG